MSARMAPLANGRAGGWPVGPLLVLGLLTAIIGLGLALPAGHGPLMPVRMAPAPVQAERALRFDERGDGSLAVFDAANGVLLSELQPEQNGFLHALVHGLSATRRRARVVADQSYGLTLYRDGRLVLADPSTHTAIDMEGFGPTNMHGVLSLLGPEAPRP